MYYNEVAPPAIKKSDWVVIITFMLSLLLAIFELLYFSPAPTNLSALFADALDQANPVPAESRSQKMFDAH